MKNYCIYYLKGVGTKERLYKFFICAESKAEAVKRFCAMEGVKQNKIISVNEVY